MAWGWLLEVPPMRIRIATLKLPYSYPILRPETALATRSTIEKEEFVLGDSLRYPRPPSPAGVERSEAGEGLSAAEDRFYLFFPCSIRLVGKRSRN
jgi:hypothetical protein